MKDNRKTPVTFEMILFGLILTGIGIMVFLFAVDAFLDSDIKLFMTILNIILILALLGITICMELDNMKNSVYLSLSLAYNHSICSFITLTMASSCCIIHSE